MHDNVEKFLMSLQIRRLQQIKLSKSKSVLYSVVILALIMVFTLLRILFIYVIQTLPPQTSVKSSESITLTFGSTTQVLSHKFLPGFKLQYPNEFSVAIKQFNELNPQEFLSSHFSSCHQACMEIQIRSDRNTALGVIFDAIHEDANIRCSNRVQFIKIDQGSHKYDWYSWYHWYRLHDSLGYFYSKSVTQDVILKKGEFIPFGEITDEWSAVANAPYAICVKGTGNFLQQKSPVRFSENGGVSILMQYPQIIGTPDTKTIRTFDQIVSSITGISDTSN